jgi:integrase
MPPARLPYLNHEKTRHGRMIWVVRVGKGRRTRLRAPYGSPDFMAAYHAAVSSPAARKPRMSDEGTFAWLWNMYRSSPAWAALSPTTKRQRENIMKLALERAGNQPLERWDRKFIIASRDARASTPAASANFLKTLRGLFHWALDAEHIDADPTANVKALKQRTEGHHTWTIDEMAAFEKRWPTGTRERLAYDVLLWTGLRRGDAYRLGPRHVRDGVIALKTEKTGRVVTLPVLKPLADSIAATPIGAETFIATLDAKPFVKESFGNWFAEICAAAGVPGRAHGLRKALSVKVAEHGATDAELDALLGWSGGGMASLYTRKASRAKLAAAALARLGIAIEG